MQQEKCRTKNGSLRTSSINWIFLQRLFIQNYSKPSITEKKKNKAKYLTWNSIRLKFVKKTSMSNPVKSLGYIKCHSLSSPRLVKSPSNSVRYNCEKIYNWSRRPKTNLRPYYLHSRGLLEKKRKEIKHKVKLCWGNWMGWLFFFSSENISQYLIFFFVLSK